MKALGGSIERRGKQALGCGLMGLLGLILGLSASSAQAQLNDTGQDKCYDGTNILAPCTDDNTGDTATWPRQDGRFGWDAAAGVLRKVGGGAAGFDFTKVCMSGELAGQGTCPANPPVGTGPNEWACTKDNITGRVWSLETAAGNLTYATTTYPAAMNATNRCGYGTDWRLPSRRELLSIIHYGKATMPTIDTDYFPNTSIYPYWSADTWASNASNAWMVNFSYGRVGINNKDSSGYLRLVRSGMPIASGRDFTDNGDGTVTDNETGLIWDKCSWGQTGMDCSSAAASSHPWMSVDPKVVDALDVAVIANTMNGGAGYKNYKDWRLPSKKELESLVDVTKPTNPTIDTKAFPNTPDSPISAYWTSTTVAPHPAYAWYVYFYGGFTGDGGKGMKLLVRLVRSGQPPADFDWLTLNQPPVAVCQDVSINADNRCQATASVNDGSYDPDGDDIALVPSPAGTYPLGDTTVTLTVTDDQGASASCTGTVNVVDNTPPAVTCPQDRVVECTGPAGATTVLFSATVSDNCTSPVTPTCAPPAGTFLLGQTSVTCTGFDAAGNMGNCDFTVQVVDTTPPTIQSVIATPTTLWPPNNKMVPVTVAVSATDVCSTPICGITEISSDEQADGDWEITGPLTVKLRAERDGGGDGRAYTIAVTCSDETGNSSTGATTVSVPHDQGKKK